MSSWELKRSLETPCTPEGFHLGLDVWVRRPNVVNRKLLGAVTRLEGPLTPSSPAWRQLDDCRLPSPSPCSPVSSTRLTIGLLVGPDSGGDVGEWPRSKVVVRELFPRVGGHQQLPSRLELVVTGMLKPPHTPPMGVFRQIGATPFFDAFTDWDRHTVSFFPLRLPNKDKVELSEAQVFHEIGYRFTYQGPGPGPGPAARCVTLKPNTANKTASNFMCLSHFQSLCFHHPSIL